MATVTATATLYLLTLSLLLLCCSILTVFLPWAARAVLSAIWFTLEDDVAWTSVLEDDVKYLYRQGRVRRYKKKQKVECCFCLCEIEEGDEVRELRCNHLFHMSCLDRWVDHGQANCPLCRRWLAVPRCPGVRNPGVYVWSLVFMVCCGGGGWLA